MQFGNNFMENPLAETPGFVHARRRIPMKNLRPLVAILVFTFYSAFASTNLWTGLVSYWPLDVASGTTPDVYFGNNLNIVGSPTVVTGQRSNAVVLSGSAQYLTISHSTNNTDTGLPIYRSGTYSVALWVKGAAQSGKYIFTEANNGTVAGSSNQLFLIQTGTGANTGKVDMFIRTDSGSTPVNHLVSSTIVFDNNWHHIAWVDDHGQGKLYVDGNLDGTNFKYTYNAALALSFTTTSIGALARATAIGFFNGQVDDAAVWERVLSQSEIQDMMANSLPMPITQQPPSFITQPLSRTNAPGDWATFSATVIGFRPFSYQWQRNGQNIANATSSSLFITGLNTNNNGDIYSVNVSSPAGTSSSSSAVLTVVPDAQPNITGGLISYWPFDSVTNVVTDVTNYWATPDLYSGNSMFLNNMTDANLVSSPNGNALSFDGFTQYASRMGGFSIYNNSNYSVALWVNANGLTQNDRRIFAEGSTSSSTPIWGIGTTAAGQDNFARVYIRSDANAAVLDRVSTRPIFDGNWHHVAWVDRNGQGKLYVDGVLDESDFTYTRTNVTVNTTGVGAVARGTPASFIFGNADEVAMWNRALSLTEIQQVISNGIPHPVSATAPSITIQPVGASVFSGGTVTLTTQAAGTSPLGYQWNKNSNPIVGATAPTLTLSNVQISDSGSYTMIVTNVAGTASSSVAVVSVSARPSAPQSLAIDFDDRSATPSDTQPGFNSFILTGSGTTTAPTTYLYGGVEATLTSVGGAPLDTRKRGAPTNSGAFTLQQVFDDFVFASQTSGTNGLALTLKYLDSNQTYNVTIHSFDSSSVGSRVSDWYANGTFIQTWTFDGSVLPTADGQDAFTFPATADSNGTLQIQGLRNTGSGTQLGVFLNGVRIDALPLRIRSTQILGNGDLYLLIDTPNAGQQHRVEQSTTLNAGSWTTVPGATVTPVTPGGQQVQTQFTPDPGQAHFYRVVRIVP
jgi:hypothetical protein